MLERKLERAESTHGGDLWRVPATPDVSVSRDPPGHVGHRSPGDDEQPDELRRRVRELQARLARAERELASDRARRVSRESPTRASTRSANAELAAEARRLREHSHLQTKLLQRRALHLRELEVRERGEPRGGVQPVALPRSHATGAAASLLRARSGDPRGLQRAHARVRVVALLFQPPRVNHEDDVVDRHRRLRDVRREDNLLHATRRTLKHLLLLRGRHHAVQGEHEDVSSEPRIRREVIPQLRDLEPPGEEDEDRAIGAAAALLRGDVRGSAPHDPVDQLLREL